MASWKFCHIIIVDEEAEKDMVGAASYQPRSHLSFWYTISTAEYLALVGCKAYHASRSREIWIYGKCFESFLMAVTIPDKKAIEDWAATHNEIENFKSLCGNPKARKYLLDRLNNVGWKNNCYAL